MLRDLEVLVLDCQASGASPAYGDLLELGWTVAGPARSAIESRWLIPKTSRPVPGPIRKLLAWNDACLAEAVTPAAAWAEVLACTTGAMPTLIHWARFEVPFLRDLHGGELPLDVICLHAVAERVFPDLPKKNLRALAGHLGHSPELLRRAYGHVEATAFIWRAVAPRLEAEGLGSWSELRTWLARPFTRSKAIVFPYPPERRKSLSDSPGVYRFLRRNGDVLYVGKAASIRKRVSSHFAAKRGKTDALEMLTQVADVDFTETATALEAALLEVDEIQRLDPPYNVQLRTAERRAWFASADFADVRDAPDATHRVGPLPSARAVAGLAAMRKLLGGQAHDAPLRAAAAGVPTAFAPDEDLFAEVWRKFAPKGGLLDAARALHPLREQPSDDEDDGWNPERLHRHLTRTLAGEGLLVRRARLLCLLADAQVRFAENGRERTITRAVTRPRSRHERQREFDARVYDRLRVFATELRRVHLEGGVVEIHVGQHRLPVASVFSAI